MQGGGRWYAWIHQSRLLFISSLRRLDTAFRRADARASRRPHMRSAGVLHHLLRGAAGCRPRSTYGMGTRLSM